MDNYIIEDKYQEMMDLFSKKKEVHKQYFTLI